MTYTKVMRSPPVQTPKCRTDRLWQSLELVMVKVIVENLCVLFEDPYQYELS